MSDKVLKDDSRNIAVPNGVPKEAIEAGYVGLFTMMDHVHQKPALARTIAEFANRYAEETNDTNRAGLLADMYRALKYLIELEGHRLKDIVMVANHLDERDGTYSDHIGLIGIVGKANSETTEP